MLYEVITIRPSSMTRIRFARRIVLKRCAITKEVRPFIRASIPRWMSASVNVSTLEVASSMMNNSGFARTALAKLINSYNFV